MSKKVLIKIDAVGSKEWCSKGIDTQSRREMLLKQLKDVVTYVYEKANLSYPEGEYISAQGDCINLAVNNPEYAVLKTIEFQREWFDYIHEYPDCRAIIDFSDVQDFTGTPNLELLSEGFENISVIEKSASKGDIFITESVLNELDSEIIKTMQLPPISIANSRTINIYKIDYEDPRELEENYLVQTIFFANSKSDSIRDKVIGSRIIEIVSLKEDKQLSQDKLISELKNKKINISEEHLKKIILNNSVLLLEENNVTIKSEKESDLETLKHDFYKEKEDTLNFIAENLSSAIGGFTADEFREIIDFDGLLQEYLFAVFGDIKNVVSYYNCEKQMDFYDRFLNPNYFDSILKEKVKHIDNFDDENRALFKKEFLRALGLLTRKQNKYISYIFHNILINYYLNRNERYLTTQLKKLKEKTFYLDTNTFYSYKVPTSQYHQKVQYIFDKLKSLSCNLRMFNITVKEYNDTLNLSKKIYKNDPYTATKGNAVPWIIYEFVKHSGAYCNNIDSCIQTHLIDSSNHEAFTKKEKIRVEKIDPVLERNDLNELCNQITSLKRNKIEQTTFEEKMLHDANCLHYLYEEEKGFAAPKLFITCDFNLARIRKFSDYGNSIITVNELYDFLLPYLLISDDNFTNPDRLPNMLLETAIDLELGDSICLEEIVGNFVKNKPDGLNYKILNSTMMSEKFEQIKKKNSIIQSSNFTEDECTIKLDENFNNFENDYIEAVKKDTIQCLREYKYSDIDEIIADSKKKLSEKDAEIITLKAKLDKLEKKEKKREKYQKKMKNQSLKPKKKNKKKRR